MCNGNNQCEYEGEMLTAYGPKELVLYCSEVDKEFWLMQRPTVSVCPECHEADWATFD